MPEYWTHMDYFPCHRAVDGAAEEELKNILRHGAVGNAPPVMLERTIGPRVPFS